MMRAGIAIFQNRFESEAATIAASDAEAAASAVTHAVARAAIAAHPVATTNPVATADSVTTADLVAAADPVTTADPVTVTIAGSDAVAVADAGTPRTEIGTSIADRGSAIVAATVTVAFIVAVAGAICHVLTIGRDRRIGAGAGIGRALAD